MALLTIIRGLPGAGKTTLAEKILYDYRDAGLSVIWAEADAFFTAADGTYTYDASKVGEAHDACFNTIQNALNCGVDAIVSNTFTTHIEMQRYLDLAKQQNHRVQVIHAYGRFESVHAVPKEALERMAARWVPYPGELVYFPA